MKKPQRVRRFTVALLAAIGVVSFVLADQDSWRLPVLSEPAALPAGIPESRRATAALDQLPVKGRAPKTDYKRTQFGSGWTTNSGCDTRNIILARDLTQVQINESCQVVSGVLADPYTGEQVQFRRGATTSQDVQIDHVVALSNAWQTGAQGLSELERINLANDPLNLLAVKGGANQQKSDGDAATWLPPNKPFRCQYVARQIAVKTKYQLWVVPPEKDAMSRVLAVCPDQVVPKVAM